jgi:dinuclear metal center YbgI/SA1388 family protein
VIGNQQLKLYLDEYLNSKLFQDYAPNGLQVEGKEKIQLLCTAVTASADVLKEAVALQADALLVHHGYFWKGESQLIVGMKRQRLAQLLSHNINLFAYHLPLDCHVDVGNNACLAKLFELNSVKKHDIGLIRNLFWTGVLPQTMTAEQLSLFLQNKLQRKPLWISSGKQQGISRIGFCSGAAQDYISVAAELGADAYISGEVSERTYNEALELGVHYFSCGHYATERLGIQALGQHVSARFDIKHHFIESNNPI